MSRIKVPYEGALFWQKLHLANEGNKFSGYVIDFYNDCKTLFALKNERGELNEALLGYFRQKPEFVERAQADLTGRFFRELRKAIDAKDGTSLRELADVIEGIDKAKDDLRSWLLILHFELDAPYKQNKFFTLTQLKWMAIERGIVKELDLRHLKRTCDALGITRRKAQVGRPKGSSKKTLPH
jgi:hypothetical protein